MITSIIGQPKPMKKIMRNYVLRPPHKSLDLMIFREIIRIGIFSAVDNTEFGVFPFYLLQNLDESKVFFQREGGNLYR